MFVWVCVRVFVIVHMDVWARLCVCLVSWLIIVMRNTGMNNDYVALSRLCVRVCVLVSEWIRACVLVSCSYFWIRGHYDWLCHRDSSLLIGWESGYVFVYNSDDILKSNGKSLVVDINLVFFVVGYWRCWIFRWHFGMLIMYYGERQEW